MLHSFVSMYVDMFFNLHNTIAGHGAVKLRGGFRTNAFTGAAILLWW